MQSAVPLASYHVFWFTSSEFTSSEYMLKTKTSHMSYTKAQRQKLNKTKTPQGGAESKRVSVGTARPIWVLIESLWTHAHIVAEVFQTFLARQLTVGVEVAGLEALGIVSITDAQ